MPTHLVLSPHLDDAALSVGGWIHQLTHSGERVVVATICAGDAPPGPHSSFAEELHTRWGLSAHEAVAARRAEDRRALGLLGAEAVHLDVPDCIYRRDPDSGEPLYPTAQAIMGALNARDDDLVRRVADEVRALAGRLADVRVIAQLGIGGHVDHQLARGAAEHSGLPLTFAEDYPYAATADRRDRWAGLAAGLTVSAETIGEDDLRAQGRAVLAYPSQFSTFWPDEADMRSALRAFFGRGGRLAVRLWA